MQASERILAWIEIFDKSRLGDHVVRDPSRRATGSEIFQSLIKDEISIDSSTINIMSNKNFVDFKYDDARKIISSPTILTQKEQDKIINTAAVFHECSDLIKLPRIGQVDDERYDEIDRIIAIYSTQKMNYIFFKKNISDITRGELSKIQANYTSDTTRKMDDILEKFNTTLENNQEASQKKYQDTLDKLKIDSLENLRSEIATYKLEIGASLVVKDAEQLWNDKHQSHKNLFYICSSIFSAAVLTVIVLSIKYWPAISKEIMALEPLFKGHILGAITLLLIPVLGFAWVLRLLSRFTIQNMILADDAQMRKVMAQTYVKLVSAKAIEDPQDRAIILTALFRPLPGAQGEDISPPSITDVLKTGK